MVRIINILIRLSMKMILKIKSKERKDAEERKRKRRRKRQLTERLKQLMLEVKTSLLTIRKKISQKNQSLKLIITLLLLLSSISNKNLTKFHLPHLISLLLVNQVINHHHRVLFHLLIRSMKKRSDNWNRSAVTILKLNNK